MLTKARFYESEKRSILNYNNYRTNDIISFNLVFCLVCCIFLKKPCIYTLAN